jgi:dCMP deaminase
MTDRELDKLGFYMQMCRDAARDFSTCGKRQYYAIILDARGVVISTGYNGGPAGAVHCVDGGCPRLEAGSAPGSSYDNCIAIHAEANALLHGDWHARQGGTIVVNGPPCYSCAKLIANSGLVRLCYLADPSYSDWDRIEGDLDGWGIETVAMV